MALINCPECGKEISDRANACIHCGFPIQDYINETKENTEIIIEVEKEECPYCGFLNNIGEDYCESCEMRLTPYNANVVVSKNANVVREEYAKSEHSFNGVYRFNIVKGMQEVYCPRCGSPDCSHYKEQSVIHGKTKAKYSLNINPLKPFTFVNKKEKGITKDKVVTENKFMCNKCGMIFK